MNTRAQGAVAEHYCLKNGASIRIRPIRPEDAGLEQAFIAALSPLSRHARFMGGIRELSPEMMERFVNVDAAHLAFIAVAEGADGLEVGVSRYFSDPGGESGEFAIVVADAWQGLGLGRLLLRKITSAALAQGLTKLTGQVLTDNTRMLDLCRSLGFSVSRQSGADDICDVSLRLSPGTT